MEKIVYTDIQIAFFLKHQIEEVSLFILDFYKINKNEFDTQPVIFPNFGTDNMPKEFADEMLQGLIENKKMGYVLKFSTKRIDIIKSQPSQTKNELGAEEMGVFTNFSSIVFNYLIQVKQQIKNIGLVTNYFLPKPSALKDFREIIDPKISRFKSRENISVLNLVFEAGHKFNEIDIRDITAFEPKTISIIEDNGSKVVNVEGIRIMRDLIMDRKYDYSQNIANLNLADYIGFVQGKHNMSGVIELFK